MFGGAPQVSKKDFTDNRTKVFKTLANFVIISAVMRAIPVALERL
jgi:hypothetical protein